MTSCQLLYGGHCQYFQSPTMRPLPYFFTVFDRNRQEICQVMRLHTRFPVMRNLAALGFDVRPERKNQPCCLFNLPWPSSALSAERTCQSSTVTQTQGRITGRSNIRFWNIVIYFIFYYLFDLKAPFMALSDTFQTSKAGYKINNTKEDN